MRRFAFGLLLLTASLTATATVVDLNEVQVKEVLDVYEQQQEVERSDQGWIHSFEQVPLGNEMDHLAKVKAASTEENLTE